LAVLEAMPSLNRDYQQEPQPTRRSSQSSHRHQNKASWDLTVQQ